MYYSHALIPTLRDDPADAEVISHKLMLRAGFIRKLSAGIYCYLPLALRVLRKIEKIVREEMATTGAQELLLPALQPSELWEETGRWQQYGKELIRLRDRHDHDFCLGPTHEEVITDLVRKEIRSYRQLPITLYQIQTKFRDEMRPRFGIMRGREFIMKDAYSFDASVEGAKINYQKMYDAYHRIFSRVGLTFRAVEADNGLIGGSQSDEFMVLTETGEEEIISCTACLYAANIEKTEVGHRGMGDPCPRCGEPLKIDRGIEVGHVFLLGTKYSKEMKALFLNERGEERFFEMGCYGIGVSRIIAAAIEQNHDEKGIIWPISIAPYIVHIVPVQDKSDDVMMAAKQIYTALMERGIDVLFDDRAERPGVKFNDADLLGAPYQIVIGEKNLEKGLIELKERKTGTFTKIETDHAISHVASYFGAAPKQ
ncbi:MAG: proline--tRNA ligase [Nitrospirae bacterium]|nr:proline--tRNA ligase [Candidatus Troglogloeales bacterium]